MRFAMPVLFAVSLGLAVQTARLQADQGVELRLGKLRMTAPAQWKQVQPRVRIIAYEFAAPKAEGDPVDGRVTVMAAGGSIEANIARWKGQFRAPGAAAPRVKVEKTKINGYTVHLVDLSGTYLDRRGPFAPAVPRRGYRMLGAIIQTPEANFFVKFYGPVATVNRHEKAFRQMIQSIR